MAERVLPGLPASPGQAVGAARVLDGGAVTAASVPASDRFDEAARAVAALEAAAAELDALAGRLTGDEAEIVEANAMMARDPVLHEAARMAVFTEGLPAAAAVRHAAEGQARILAALDDPTLATRADDVRSLARRAARHATAGGAASGGAASGGAASGGAASAGPPSEEAGSGVAAGVILIARDLGPADVAELDGGVRGIALAAGGPTAHAAIVARALGVPMAVGLGEGLLEVADGTAIVVDGDAGTAVAEPAPGRAAAARAAAERRERARARSRADRDRPAITRDGRRVRVLANVATAAEVPPALEAGAEGAGLIRTELAFLDADGWPDERAHRAALAPVLAALGERTATVRLLDFGGDKTPPFIARTEARGIGLLLENPDALTAQLRAVATLAGDADLRILLPYVQSADQIARVRALVEHAGIDAPLGAMVEDRDALAALDELALAADFLSIGTNDLTAAVLGTDRFGAAGPPPSGRAASRDRPGASGGQPPSGPNGSARGTEPAAVHHPAVLSAVAAVVAAAHGAGRIVEVCGEAASEPVALPLLVGLGVDEVSVGAARVGAVRAWVRDLDQAAASELVAAALREPSARDVAALVGPTAGRLALLERGDAADERVEGGAGVVAVGPQP